jgi:hypothetical protein
MGIPFLRGRRQAGRPIAAGNRAAGRDVFTFRRWGPEEGTKRTKRTKGMKEAKGGEGNPSRAENQMVKTGQKLECDPLATLPAFSV